MPVSSSPYKVIEPKDRWVPSNKEVKEKDLMQVLPPLVKRIREEVSEWRKKDYPGVSNTSKSLLKWWFFTEHENFEYFFAQREAVESIIYIYEVVGIRNKEKLYETFNSYPEVTIKHFIEKWIRMVIKMATGSGKTKVMSLLLVWSYFNRIYEENNEFSSNFLIVAPNIIVLDRLKGDFDSLSIFRNDPCLPDDGYENQNWKSEFLNNIDVHIQKQGKVNKKSGNIFLTNIQQIYTSTEKEPSLEDDDKTEFFFGKKPKSTLETDIDLLKIIKQIDNLIIMNDEGHHIHEENQWHKTIEDIHNNLSLRNSKLTMQLDFTATPKHKDSSIFVQTICDYPLIEAIQQNIVKNIEVPKKESRAKLQDYPSTKFSEKWKDYINLGYQEWKKSFDFHQKSKKKAILFIMTDDTKNCDDTARFLENNYDDLKGQILTIHTKNNGELYEKTSDLKSMKSKEDLKNLRNNANSIDDYNNPYKVIVSVLMLKEGWDVNNVTTIVGLRPYDKPKILPEQTLGRGLRKMYRDANLEERLTVIGTPNFMEFASELRKEGVTIKEIEMGGDVDNPFYISSEIIEDKELVDKFDIEFPNIIEKIFKNEEKIAEIDPAKFDFKTIEYKNVENLKKEKIIWQYSASKEVSRVSEFVKSYALDSYNILSALVKDIMDELQLKKGMGFEIICNKTKSFIENYLFGKKVEFDNEITKANLCSIEARRTIIETLVKEIKKVIIDEKSGTEVSKIFKFSEDKNRRIKNFEKTIYTEPTKSVYTHHFFDSGFEEEVDLYLNELPDVISCIKNMNFISIPYQDVDGKVRYYVPDFFVKISQNEYCIVETKGAEYINDRIKREALEKNIKEINKAQDKIKYTSLYVLEDKFKKEVNKPSTFKNFFEMFKDLSIN